MEPNPNKEQPKSNAGSVVMPTSLVSSTTQTLPPIMSVPVQPGDGPFLLKLKETLEEMATKTKTREREEETANVIIAVDEKVKTGRKLRIPKTEPEDSALMKSLDEIIVERKILVPRKFSHPSGSILDATLNQVIKERKIIAPSRESIRMNSKGKLEEMMISDNVAFPKSSVEGWEDESSYVTPLQVIQSLMTKDGLAIKHVCGHNPKLDPGNREINWQSVISCGGISVTVNATSKDLAKQAAALRLICILKKIHPSFAYPKQCLIPEATFYDLHHSIALLFDHLRVEGLLGDATYYTSHGEKDKHDYFTTFINVGGVLKEPITGSAFNEDHSRLLAVKAAYDALMGRELPRGEFHVVKESRGKQERHAADVEETENLDDSKTLHINVEEKTKSQGAKGGPIWPWLNEKKKSKK